MEEEEAPSGPSAGPTVSAPANAGAAPPQPAQAPPGPGTEFPGQAAPAVIDLSQSPPPRPSRKRQNARFPESPHTVAARGLPAAKRARPAAVRRRGPSFAAVPGPDPGPSGGAQPASANRMLACLRQEREGRRSASAPPLDTVSRLQGGNGPAPLGAAAATGAAPLVQPTAHQVAASWLLCPADSVHGRFW